MTQDEAQETLYRVQKAIRPNRLPKLTIAELTELYDSLCEALPDIPVLILPPYYADEILRVLLREIDAKRAVQRGAQQHGESMKQGSTILIWTKRAVLVGVLVPILVALIAEIPFSKLLRAIASESRPRLKSSMTMILVTPAPTAQPSETPQESPMPESTSTPTATPIKFPPPAP